MKVSLVLMRERLLIILLFGVIAAIVLSPLASDTQIPKVIDYFNHIATIVQAQLAMAEGQFPLRISPVVHTRWGYPLFQFYSPTGYTLSGLVYHWITPANPFLAFKLTIWLFLVIGGCYMYKLANWFVNSRAAAILAGVVYLTSPYYFIVVDNMGGFNEALALGIVPAVLYYTLQRYYYPADNRLLLITAFAWYLLATIHIITFAYTSFFLALLLFFATLRNPNHWSNLLRTGIAYVFGLMMAMWYLAPAYLFRDSLNINRMIGSVADFNKYKPSFFNLISPTENITSGKIGISGLVDSISMFHPGLGFPLLFAAAICFYAYFNRASLLDNERANTWLMPLLVLFAIGFVMVWSPFNFSTWVPHTLMIGQYSWRILGQVIWIGALLFAWAICWLFKNKLDARHVVIGLFLVLLATSARVSVAEKDLVHIDVADIKTNPTLSWGTESYLIDTRKNMNMVNAIDSVPIDTLIANNELLLNHVYKLPIGLFNTAINPVLLLRGNVSEEDNDKFSPQQISVLVNGAEMSNVELKGGPLYWEIPLANAKKLPASIATVDVVFKSTQKNIPNSTIILDKVAISGFQNNEEIINVKQAEAYCEPKSTTTVCQFDVAPEIKLIELPVLYYPDLLNITLNGKTIPYTSMLYSHFLIVAVKPLPGVLNTIKVEFRGLVWANTFSWIAWGLWLMFFIYLPMKRIFSQTRA